MAAKEKRGLGIGLDALFGPDLQTEPDEIRTLPLSQVEPRQDQPRESFDEERLQDLAASISRHGLIQPVIVRRLEDGYYQIIAGERRWRAARMAGLLEIPVRVLQADDRSVSELALVENLQREDLNPMEEARGYQKLIDDYGLTQEDASAGVGKSRSAVANALRLLNLCKPVAELVENGTLSAGHARALLSLEDPALQEKGAQEVLNKSLSVRKTELLAAKWKKEAAHAFGPEGPRKDRIYLRQRGRPRSADRTTESTETVILIDNKGEKTCWTSNSYGKTRSWSGKTSGKSTRMPNCRWWTRSSISTPDPARPSPRPANCVPGETSSPSRSAC